MGGDAWKISTRHKSAVGPGEVREVRVKRSGGKGLFSINGSLGLDTPNAT